MDTERVRLARRTTGGRSRFENLLLRASAVGALRQQLAARGYVEVEPNVLVRAPGTDPHIEPVEVPGFGYLSTSPEFQMKRLLVGGFERIYAIVPAFRAGEWGPHHEVEFTMAEWYAAGMGYRDLARELEDILSAVAQEALGTGRVSGPGGAVDLGEPWEHVTVQEAFVEHVGADPFDPFERFQEAVAQAGVFLPEDADWEEVFFRAFVERVEPNLGRGRPTVLLDWPEPQSALARVRVEPDGRRVAERFEVFAGGLELANAFGELTDPAEQAARFEAEQATRRRKGLPALPVDERFLTALREGMPEASGIALGVDRLVMLLAGASHIRDVRAFVYEEL